MSADDIKLPELPTPYRAAVYANARNTPAVKQGYEQGGYEKEPPLYTAQQMQDYARAAVLADREGQQWQPIETAPRDGTRLLLATPRGRMADGEFHARYGVWSWPYVMVEPTLWRSLPTPPTDAQSKGAHDGNG